MGHDHQPGAAWNRASSAPVWRTNHSAPSAADLREASWSSAVKSFAYRDDWEPASFKSRSSSFVGNIKQLAGFCGIASLNLYHHSKRLFPIQTAEQRIWEHLGVHSLLSRLQHAFFFFSKCRDDGLSMSWWRNSVSGWDLQRFRKTTETHQNRWSREQTNAPSLHIISCYNSCHLRSADIHTTVRRLSSIKPHSNAQVRHDIMHLFFVHFY